jgi:cytochrome c oxidase assembly protein subunit 15
VLGGVTVLYRLPLAVSVTHACLAQVFFCLTVALAVVTGREWARPRPLLGQGRPALAVLAAAATAVVFVQVVLGAFMRHMGAGLAIPDFPLAFGRLIPPLVTPLIAVHFAHRLGALAVTGAVGWTAVRILRRHGDERALRRPALLAAALLALQLLLGAFTIWSRRAVLPTTAHLVVGAGLLATCLVLALYAARTAPADAAVSQPVDLRERAVA